ncbi:hypothetical protein [Mycobacterium sp. 852002-51057_SCH5723018]|uniref:hypothetical protein n=1 Tax=Mycobacterium sp. 852002-51057_SCH5723018 TaxID=1834094 RepID=UPI0007FE5637|nr:hypothetical protein [Mycobacterium sp. 852002-51057_SCH5723018]OBG28770.1 hypothetical protein A5764_24545 [Mycobacterium sp. 852002-51057_SCH5723018]
MGAKHRMTEALEQRQPLARRGARRRMSGLSTACEIVSASMLCAASLTALVAYVEPEKPTVQTTLGPPVSQPVRQEGTVIAVSADSVTARSANGYTQTYRVTPNTTVISRGVGQPASAASHFTVNDQVDIVGTIQDGTALATAVADRGESNGDGAPMDYIAAQSVSGAPGST